MTVDRDTTGSAGIPAEPAPAWPDATGAAPASTWPDATGAGPAGDSEPTLEQTAVSHSAGDATEVGGVEEAAPVTASGPHRKTSAWRRWRRGRPFWGGLLIVLGGVEILVSEQAPLRVIVHLGVQGLAGYLVPSIMVLCGLLLWFSPQQRLFYALLATLLSLASWVTSNLGGFFIGLLLGLIGGSLAFAWTPKGPARVPGPRGGHRRR